MLLYGHAASGLCRARALGAPHEASELLRRREGDVGGVVDTARAAVARHLRVGAERMGPGRVSALHMGAGDALRGRAFLHPVHYPAQPVGGGAGETGRVGIEVEHGIIPRRAGRGIEPGEFLEGFV